MNEHIYFMEKALVEAKKAYSNAEIPVGAIIVKDGKIISTGYNKREQTNLSISHAEIIAISKANLILQNWRLNECIMYVTLEPCIMCSGAIYNSRIKKIYFGAYDFKKSSIDSVINILNFNNQIHNLEYEGGLLENECSQLLKDFFINRRKQNSK